jgi:hypothetical protein
VWSTVWLGNKGGQPDRHILTLSTCKVSPKKWQARRSAGLDMTSSRTTLPALAAQALILTLHGVPLFYDGMEMGDATESGDPAIFEKMPVFWHPGGLPPLRDI